MTPLEEIERELSYAEKMFSERLSPERMLVFGALYQARALERLEATVRAIGVQWQQYADIVVPIMQRVDARTEAQAQATREEFAIENPEAEPHEFYNPIPGRTLCGICGFTRTDKRHPTPPPIGVCLLCGIALGEQHSPHCSRQGKVTVDSLRNRLLNRLKMFAIAFSTVVVLLAAVALAQRAARLREMPMKAWTANRSAAHAATTTEGAGSDRGSGGRGYATAGGTGGAGALPVIGKPASANEPQSMSRDGGAGGASAFSMSRYGGTDGARPVMLSRPRP